MDILRLVIILGSTLSSHVHGAQQASISCIESGTNIEARLRLKRGGDSVTSLVSYDQLQTTAETGAECTTDTVTNDVLELVLIFDPLGSLPCGMVKNGTLYNWMVKAEGTTSFYLGRCDSTNLAGTMVESGSLDVAGSVPIFSMYERSRNITFRAVTKGTDGSLVPATDLLLGQEVQLQLILDKGTTTVDSSQGSSGSQGTTFHTGFLRTISGAVLSLDIYTLESSANVDITYSFHGGGQAGLSTVVTRGMPITYTIPVDVQPTSTATVWKTEAIGIKIESNLDIGVRVNSLLSDLNKAESFRAYPDESLGTEYRLVSAKAINQDAQALIIGVSDDTQVTITIHESTLPPGLKHEPSGLDITSPFTFTLNEFETFHIYCEDSCEKYGVVANKPVAVISGHGQDTASDDTTVQGHMVSQMPSVTQFAQNYVIVKLRPGVTDRTWYRVMLQTPNFNTPEPGSAAFIRPGPAYTLFTDARGFGNPFYLDHSTVIWPSAEELQSDVPVVLVQFSDEGQSNADEPSMVTIPPVSQWTTRQTVSVKKGSDYDFYVIASKNELDSLIVTTSAGDTESMSGYADRTDDIGNLGFTVNEYREDVTPIDVHVGGTANYEFASFTVSITTDISWVTFEAMSTDKPFMVLVYELNGESKTSYSPFDLEISSCTAASIQGANVPIYPGVRLNDMIDNDCDGHTDEEIPNGLGANDMANCPLDDDADTLVDEDIGSGTVAERVSTVGIYNTKLQVSTSASFTTSETIIVDGCNVNSANPTSAVGQVGHFTSAASQTNDYWVIETNTFPIFRFRDTASLYFRATVDFCDTYDGLCSDSCPGRRKRHDSLDESTTDSVTLVLNVVDARQNPEDNQETESHSSSCYEDPVYWSMVAVFLIVIALEVTAISIFFRKRKQIQTLHIPSEHNVSKC